MIFGAGTRTIAASQRLPGGWKARLSSGAATLAFDLRQAWSNPDDFMVLPALDQRQKVRPSVIVEELITISGT